jgi:hypothetical protein
VPRRPPLALLVALSLLLAAACSGSGSSEPVSLTGVPGVTGSALQTCTQLQTRLPATLHQGQKRRETTPTSPTTAAWGDPAVLLRCGVSPGDPRDEPYEFNGVRWTLHDTGASRTWTSARLRVNVSVEVPDAYSGQAELLGALAPTLLTLGPA